MAIGTIEQARLYLVGRVDVLYSISEEKVRVQNGRAMNTEDLEVLGRCAGELNREGFSLEMDKSGVIKIIQNV